MTESLNRKLVQLRDELNLLPEATEPPSTTLHIIRNNQQEQDWQRLLFHYLSPDEAHGLNHALLEHILSALADRGDMEFSFSRFDLMEVETEQEVTIPNGRRPDAVIWASNEWFICWELKINASEGQDQTQDYVEANSFQSIGLSKEDVPEANHHYVYLAPEDSYSTNPDISPPEAAEFTPVPWEWIANEIQTFLAECQGEYPGRTIAQLETFVGTIRSEIMTTEYQENQQEKAELYFDYYSDIGEAKAAFENEWDRFIKNWGTRLAHRLDDATIVDDPDLPSHIVAVDTQLKNDHKSRWLLRQDTADWWGIGKEDWHKRTDNLSTIYERHDDQSEVGIRFFNRAEKHQEQAIKDGEIELTLWHLSSNDEEFITQFNDELAERVSSISLTPSVEHNNAKTKPIKARYDIPFHRHDSFFDAYTVGLQQGFVDLTVNNSSLIDVIDDTYKRSIEMYR